MARQFAKDGTYGVTAFTFGSADILDELGSGTLKVETALVDNGALKDGWTHNRGTKRTATFTGELACDTTENVAWWTQVGAVGAMLYTDGISTMSGDMVVESAEKSVNDAMRWNVSMKNADEMTAPV